METVIINTKDNLEVEEKLTNEKPWFNGVKSFSSVKVNPSREPPTVLKINVNDAVSTKGGLV
jgi:hypothetical protein